MDNSSAVQYTRTHQLTAGISYCLLSSASLLAHSLFLTVLARNWSRFSAFSYLISVHLSIADCLQLVGHFCGGVLSIANDTFVPWLSRVVGGIRNSAWLTAIAFNLLLAVERFLQIVCNGYANRLRGFRSYVLLSCAWLHGLTYLTFYMSGLASFVYEHEASSFVYVNEDSSRWTLGLDVFELVSTVVIFSIIGALYMSCAIKLLALRRGSIRKVFYVVPRMLSVAERVMLLHGVLVSLHSLIFSIAWIIQDSTNLWVLYLIHLFWIIAAANNAILSLAINRTVRQLAIAFLRGKVDRAALVQKK